MSGRSNRRLHLTFGRHSVELGAMAALIICHTISLAAPITSGNLVLVRVAGGPNGDASAPLSGGGTAAAVFLDEYTTAGVFVQSIAMPTTLNATVGSQRALTLAGTANTEGHLTLSGNGQYFIVGGYNQTATAAGTNGSASNVVERVVGRVDFNGNIDTTTALVDAMSQQNIRSAYSTNGTDFWVTGNGGNNVTINAASVPTTGVHKAQLGVNTGGTTLSTQVNTTGNLSNNRQVLSFANNLYVTSGNTSSPNATARGVDIMGSVATGLQLYSLPGFSTGPGTLAPDDFWFFDASTIYLADTRTDGTNGGIQKWTFNGTAWALQYTLGSGAGVLTTISGGNAGVHGLTGRINGSGQAVLFGTTFDGAGANQTKFFTITDTGAASAVTYLGTSATNTAFRGIEIALPAPIPEPGSMCLLMLGVLFAAARRRRER